MDTRNGRTVYTLDVINTQGIPFTVVLAPDGYWYREGKQTTAGPLVEFYDARHKDNGDRCHRQGDRRGDWSMFGQFVCAYNLDTIVNRNDRYGLDLYGGEDDWTIDAHTMLMVVNWLTHMVARLPELDGAEVFAKV